MTIQTSLRAAAVTLSGILMATSTPAQYDVQLGVPYECRVGVCDANFQQFVGDATADLAAHEARSRATGGAFNTANSSIAEVGVAFTPCRDAVATVTMANVFWFGSIQGFGNVNTGSYEVKAFLRDLTTATEIDSEVLASDSENGNIAQSVIKVINSFVDPALPAGVVFENVALEEGHQYGAVLRITATGQGLFGNADFRSGTRRAELGVVIVESGGPDQDGDGLFDLWEDEGIDVDCDGLPELDLPGFGANKMHKDLFLELDWRTGEEPTRAAILAMKQTFAAAPKDAGGTVNPDDTVGINLWIDTGDLMENGMLVGDNFGGGNEITDPVICLDDSFYDAKSGNFDPGARRLAFRYGVLGISPDENDCADGTNPGGLGEIGGNDFISYTGDPGTIIHELGHTLDLRHGGFENLNNKPPYVSIMNYNYGLNIPQFSGGGILDFSPPLCPTCPGGRGAIPDDLDESQLDETKVLDPNDPENMFIYRDLLAITQGAPMSGTDTDNDGSPDVDWDGDGTISIPTVIVDVNEDGKCVEPGSDGVIDTAVLGDDDVLLSDNIIHDGPDRQCDTMADPMDTQRRPVGAEQEDVLASYDDWSNIELDFRQFGDSADGPIDAAAGERSLAETRDRAEANNTADLELVKTDLPDPVNAGEPLVYTLTVTNHGPMPARGIRVVDTLPAEATYVADTGGCVEEAPGILTCELDTLGVGDSAVFGVTVIVDADAVVDQAPPATVENSATVDNRVPYGLNGSLGEVGSDPDESNNSDSEETVVNRPPVSDPNGPYLEECEGAVTAVALDGSASFDPDGDPITFEWTTDCPGGTFDDPTVPEPILTVESPPPCPVVCTVSLTVTDPMNLSDTESTSVTIEDTTPPTITVELDPDQLWPPNHRLVDVVATVVAEDVCDPSPTIELTSITSDEPDDAKGNGDGNTDGDIRDAELGTADFEFRLRAERAGSGVGRTYTVTYTATDDCGSSTSASATLFVPHDNS